MSNVDDLFAVPDFSAPRRGNLSTYDDLFADPFASDAPVAPTKRTWTEAAKDTGVQLAEGVNTIAGAVPNLVAPEGKTAEFFNQNAKFWRDKQSDVLKTKLDVADQAISKAGEDGMVAQIAEAASQYFKDPAMAARFVTTNLPSMIPGIGAAKLAQGAALARGATAVNAAKAATTAAGATNAALNAGGARGEAFEDIKQTLIQQGLSPEDAEQQAIKDSRVVAAVGAVTGFVSGKTGLEKSLFGKATTKGALKSGVAATTTELAGEQLEEVTPKVATNLQAGKYDGRSATKDVGRTIVETAIGSGPGAVIAGATSAMDDGEATPPVNSPSRQFTQSAFANISGDEAVLQKQQQDRTRISLALSQLDDAELETATTHLAAGNTELQQLLKQSARSPETAQLQEQVLNSGTEEYVQVADAIRRDAGLTTDNTETTPTAPAAAADAMTQMQTTAVDPTVAPTNQAPGQLNSAGFEPEPIAQIQAQLLAVGDGRKPGVVMGMEEAQALTESGALDNFAVAQAMDDNGATVVFVGRTNEEVQAAAARVQDVGLMQASGEFLKYAEPRATSDLPEGASVIQQIDENLGQIIDEQIVTPATADRVNRIPGTVVRALSVDQAMAERQQKVGEEQQLLQQLDQSTAFKRQEQVNVPQATQAVQAAQEGPQAPAAPSVAPLRQMATAPSTASPRMTAWVDNFNADRGLQGDDQVDAGSIREFTPLPKSPMSKIAAAVKQAFGVDVVFVDMPKGGMMRKNGSEFNRFNGFADMKNNQLVLNVDAATALNTLGHELTHLLQANHPEIYAKLELVVLSRLSAKKAAEFKKFLSTAMTAEGDRQAVEAEYRAEIVAEAMGEMAEQESFWADVFGRLDKEQAKTLYDAVMQALQKLANALTKNAFIPGVKDMQKVRRAATDAFIGWAAKEANLQDADNIEPSFPVTLADNDPLLTNTMEINTPERIALRKKLIDDHFKGKKPVTDGSQTMVVLGGGGGVGKTTILKAQQKTGAFPADAEMVKINADDIKMSLPEYKQIVATGDWRAAMTTHAESSLLGKVIQYRALGLTAAEVSDEMKPYMPTESGGTFNILLDATMSEPKKGLTLVREAKARGYKVSMLAVVANAKTAIARAVKRGEGSGRFVPLEVLAGAHAGFLDSIGLYSNVVDEFTLHDNDVSLGESAFKLDIKNGNHQNTLNRFRQSAEEVRSRYAGDGRQSQGQGRASVKPAELGRASEGDERGGTGGGQANGLARFSRENILAVTQGNRIAPMAVLDEPTKSMAQSGLDRRLPIRMEQSVVEKLLTGKDGLRRAMTPDEILDLKAQLENPVAVLDDPTDKNSVVLLTATLIDGEPLVVAISKTPVEKTYPIDNVSSLGRKTQGASTERAKFSPLKTAYSKDVGGILRWVQTTKIKHFDMGLATKAYGKDLAPVTNALNIKSVTDKAYRVKEGVDGPLGRPAYDSGPTPPTLKQQGKELASSTEASVAQPKRIGANTLTLRKKLDSLTESRFSRDLTSDENQDEVGIADDSSIAPDVLHGRDGVVEKNRRWMSGDRKGQYIGAPDAYNTPGKIVKLRQIFRNLAKEGERGRFWYEESGRAVLQFVGGNPVEARKFVSLLAIYSPQAKVNANTTMALSAWVQYKSGQPINTKTELLDGNATKVLYENKQWGGEKTNNFYKNLMREVDLAVGHPSKQGATIDMWMMRAAGYESDAPTAAQYRFVENETNLLAKELGWEPQQVQAAIWAAIKARTENKGVKQRTEAKSTKKGYMEMVIGAKGKPVRQINNAAKHRAMWLKEAFGHEVTEDDTTQAIYHFGTALGERSAQLSWEATPGASTGVLPGIFSAPVSQQQEYLTAIQEALQDENGHDLIDKQIGLLVDGGTAGFSGWKGELSVGVQQQAPVYVKDREVSQLSRNLIELSLAIRGLVLKQEGMAWHFPIYKGSAYGQNGAEINLGRSLNSLETAVLYKAISDDLGHTFAPPIPTKNGFRVLNFPDAKFALMDDNVSPEDKKRLVKELGDSNKAFHEAVRSAVSKQAWATEITGSSKFESDGNLIENNWENGDGDYRRAISEKSGALGQGDQGRGAKRPDLLKWVDDELVPRVNRVNERFAEKYGWGEPTRFSRTADAQAVARLAEPAGRPSVGSGPGQRGSTVSQAIHYGKQAGLNTLVGAQFGKGIRGAEQERLNQSTDPRIKRRVYFYLPLPGGIPASESGLGGNVYSADLTNLYDPDGTIKGSGNAFESAVLDAGYRGYMNREQGTVVVMNEDVPVRHLGTSDQFNRVQRLIQRIIPKVATRTEGNESVRKMDQIIGLQASKSAKAAAPSFKMEYGEARVATTEKNAANEALGAEGSSFRFSRRTKPDPDSTVTAYKLFRMDKRKPGQLFPLFVDANTPVPVGEWLDADEGEMKGDKVKSKIGPLAYRPGWHAGDVPLATHIGEKSASDLVKPDLRPDDHVWAEIEMAADRDWQTIANQRGTNKDGKIVPVKAHITDQLPADGFYRYKTNSNMTGNWMIGGSIKVTRILTDAEVESINSKQGVADLPRKAPLDLGRYGFSQQTSFSRMQDDMDRQIDFMQQRAEEAGYTDADEFIDKDYDGFVEAAREWRQEHPENTLFSRNATKLMTVAEAQKFAKDGKLPFTLGDALRRLNFADAFMLAKSNDERSQLVQNISDATIKTFADSLIPVQRWIEGLPLSDLFKQRMRGDMRRADTVRSAKEKEVESQFAERMYLAIEKASGKYSTDQIKKFAGQWMTAKYAPKANRILIAKDRAKLKAAQAEMAAASRELSLAQQARVAARMPGVSGAQVSVAALRLANAIKRDAEAPGKVADAMRELNERLVDVNGPVGMTGFTRGVAGGFNDATAADIVKDIESKIDAQLLADIAKPVYEMLAWKKQLDLTSGKVTQTMVNSWANHVDYVPLTGDPRFDEFSADIFQYGNQLNQDADKEMNGRKDSIADDGIDAAFTAVTKSINFAAFQDFKRSLNNAYESAQRQGSDIGLQRVPVSGIVRNGDDVVIYREATVRGMKAYAFKFDDKEVIDALKKGNHETVNAFVNVMSIPTRLYGRLVTQFAPAFAPINFIRDVWERSEFVRVKKIYDQSGKQINTDKVARFAIANAINPQLWIAAAQVNFNLKGKGKLRAELEEFIATGGSSTWGSYLAKSSGGMEADIRSNTGKITRGANTAADAVSAWNNTFEMIAPLAIYLAMKKQNVAAKDAAAETLDLMNFRKRGTAMPAIRALYVFAQPAATSGYNLAQYLSTPKGKKRFAAQVVVGTALYALLASAWGDDDDEELGNKMDNLPNYTVERSIPVKMGDMMVKIPVGFGAPQLAWAFAGILNRLSSGRYDIPAALGEASKAWVKSSAPISPSEMEISKRPLDFMMTTLFPTVAKPILNIFADQTGMGSPLTPQFKDDKKMNYEQARRSTPQLFSDLAESIHEMTGIDLFPDHIKAISDGYMIGPMREVMSHFVDNPAKELRGEKARLPIVASLLDNVNDRQLLNAVYYRERDDIAGVAKEYESRIARNELGDWVTPEKTAQLMAYKQFKSQELMFSKMRNQIRKSDLDDEMKGPQLQALEERADVARRNVLVTYLQNKE